MLRFDRVAAWMIYFSGNHVYVGFKFESSWKTRFDRIYLERGSYGFVFSFSFSLLLFVILLNRGRRKKKNCIFDKTLDIYCNLVFKETCLSSMISF